MAASEHNRQGSVKNPDKNREIRNGNCRSKSCKKLKYAEQKCKELKSKEQKLTEQRLKEQRLTKQKLRKQKRKRRRLWLWGMTAVAFLLALWGLAAEEQVRILPDYPQVDITEYLNRQNLTEGEYSLLFQQTGLAPSGIDALRGEGRQAELLILQEKLFAEVPVICKANTLITREEKIAKEDRITEGNGLADPAEISAGGVTGQQEALYASIPCVEEGDILITFNSHFLGWRNGHAAMVVDAKRGLTLEASVLGSDTAVMSMEHWKQYPSFVVLRLKGADREERSAIAEYAGEQMTGVPYRLTAGWGDWIYSAECASSQVSDTPTGEAITGTQCAHLVWYVYEQFGYDLDSDGGLVVTPRDLYESPMLEVVQVYGMRIVP